MLLIKHSPLQFLRTASYLNCQSRKSVNRENDSSPLIIRWHYLLDVTYTWRSLENELWLNTIKNKIMRILFCNSVIPKVVQIIDLVLSILLSQQFFSQSILQPSSGVQDIHIWVYRGRGFFIFFTVQNKKLVTNRIKMMANLLIKPNH